MKLLCPTIGSELLEHLIDSQLMKEHVPSSQYIAIDSYDTQYCLTIWCVAVKSEKPYSRGHPVEEPRKLPDHMCAASYPSRPLTTELLLLHYYV